MKILLLGFSKIKYMPYANFYLKNINLEANEVHVVYWNRDLKEEKKPSLAPIVWHEFAAYQEDDVSKKSKIKGFISYRRYVKKLLKKNSFDFIVVLHTMPGILLYSTLTRKYKNKFLFDYRDSTYEKIGFFRRMIGNLVKSSKCTFTSSDGFRVFFPDSEKAKIHTSHNLNKEDLLHRSYTKTESEKIRIAFWGFIRGEEINRKIIDRIAKDTRFELHYYGREQQVALELKAYAKEIAAENVFFHGEYKPDDRYEFVRNTDIIHNVYSGSNMMLAMPNKYYDGAVFYIPQICMRGSHMGAMVEKSGIGLQCDPEDGDFTQRIFEYKQGLDPNAFGLACDVELQRVLNEYNSGERIIKDVLHR